MAGTCAFCGANATMTGEHVFGDWLSRIGLDLQPVLHVKGPHNRLAQNIGVTPPFLRTVRDVCGPCNHGWMSDLEGTAKRVLRPIILGEANTIEAADQGAIAAWVQKTMLVSMLVSSDEERRTGYGLPPTEYRALYEQREKAEPLPVSQFWVGQYLGDQRFASTWATPVVVAIDDLPEEPAFPHGYVMTIVLGQLLLHGLQFTSPTMQVSATPSRALNQIWPTQGAVAWPVGPAINDEGFVSIASGLEFDVAEPHLRLRPWKPATELATSDLDGSMIKLPTLCGKHVTLYPAVLAQEAIAGARHTFVVSCECDIAYLIETTEDGARCKLAGAGEEIERRYDERDGLEFLLEDSNGQFVYKLLEPGRPDQLRR